LGEQISVEEVGSRVRNLENIIEGNSRRNKYSLPAYQQSIIVLPSYSGGGGGKQQRRQQAVSSSSSSRRG